MSFDDKIAKEWLSGKAPAPRKRRSRLNNSEGIPLVRAHSLRGMSGKNSAYNRSKREPLNLDLLELCFRQMRVTGKPLPDTVTEQIIEDIRLLKSHREATMFRHEKKTPTLDPRKISIQIEVVSYVESVKKHNLDSRPLAEILADLGVPKSTYYSWRAGPYLPYLIVYEPQVGLRDLESNKDYKEKIDQFRLLMEKKREHIKAHFRKT